MIETIRCVTPDGAINGARVTRPSGEPKAGALVFVHGVGSTAAIWDTQLETFGKDRLCTAIELRGNGALKPDPDPALITRSGYAQDVLTIADALAIERFTLIGCSLGGVVGFELWLRTPERIESFVLLGSFARYPNGDEYARKIASDVRDAGSMRIFAERRAAKLGLAPARLRETIEQMACKSVECYLASTQATWTGDYLDVLPTINVPVLVAYGERDAIAPGALSEEIATRVTGARLAMIPGAGHVANADEPERFNEMLRSFVASNHGNVGKD
ncbi:MAG: alpha/beta fold hydrolase [Candidatus Eremiobacteraeota bacterium]|nr:alpha/beta fold hydrolase [Candidatus Eremiobacteraeota bacterium]